MMPRRMPCGVIRITAVLSLLTRTSGQATRPSALSPRGGSGAIDSLAVSAAYAMGHCIQSPASPFEFWTVPEVAVHFLAVVNPGLRAATKIVVENAIDGKTLGLLCDRDLVDLAVVGLCRELQKARLCGSRCINDDSHGRADSETLDAKSGFVFWSPQAR